MPTRTKRGYHHVDLRATLLETALRMLEAGEPFSLRALTREAGVSPAAPYRHFADRDALESALAAQGLRDLKAALIECHILPTSPAELAVSYVAFAMRRPALFRLMFGNQCEDGSEERVRAAAAIRDQFADATAHGFPASDPEPVASAGWAMAHGLAYLHLDGKFPEATPEQVAMRVRQAFAAVLTPDTG